jgi:hypothetical protein
LATGEIPATIIPQDNQTVKSFPENTTRPEVTNRTAEQDLKNMTGTLNATGTPMSPEEGFFCYTFGDDGTCDESQLETNTASPMITLVPWESIVSDYCGVFFCYNTKDFNITWSQPSCSLFYPPIQ